MGVWPAKQGFHSLGAKHSSAEGYMVLLEASADPITCEGPNGLHERGGRQLSRSNRHKYIGCEFYAYIQSALTGPKKNLARSTRLCEIPLFT